MVNLVPLKKWKTTKDDVEARNKRGRGGRFSSACVSIHCAVLGACARKHTHPNHPSSIDQIWNQIFGKEKYLCLEGCLKDDIRVDISPDVVKLKLGGIIVESREKPAFAGGSDCDGWAERRASNCRLIGSVGQLGTHSAARKRVREWKSERDSDSWPDAGK